MLLKNIAKKIDNLFCLYLGIHKEKIRLHSLHKKNNFLTVIYALPYKRHIFKEPLNNFNFRDFTQSHPNINDKLGLAVGKTIAKDLVISFEEVKIDSSEIE